MEKQESSTAGKGDTQVSSTLEGLVEMLSDDNEGKRWKAAESLGRMGDPRAVEPLIDTLWDDDVPGAAKSLPGHWVCSGSPGSLPLTETLPDRAGGCPGEYPGSNGDDQTGDERQPGMNVYTQGFFRRKKIIASFRS